jgi:hypothetical protein
VLEQGAEERRVYLPRGDWLEFDCDREHQPAAEPITGGHEIVAPAPRERIPVWVRRGAIVVTYPSEHVATGLGDVAEGERPLEATLWGEPDCGRAQAVLVDGTRLRWDHGTWSAAPEREVSYRVVEPSG